MTQRAIYQPEPLLGIETLKPEPIECEILEYLADDMVHIRYSVPENALIFILGGVPKEKRKAFDQERIVSIQFVHVIQ